MQILVAAVLSTILLFTMVNPYTIAGSGSSDNNNLVTVELDEIDIPIDSILSGSITAESDPGFIFLDNEDRTLKYGNSSFWQDLGNFCQTRITCSEDSTSGFTDNSSYRISTSTADERPCNPDRLPCLYTWIYGVEISDIKPSENYIIITHMKLNEYVNRSHITIQGYNETSEKWHNIIQCPKGTNGPVDWKRFTCEITIPEDMNRIRPILYKGWSSNAGNNAITWFDEIYIIHNNTISKNVLSNPTAQLHNPLFPFFIK